MSGSEGELSGEGWSSLIERGALWTVDADGTVLVWAEAQRRRHHVISGMPLLHFDATTGGEEAP